MAVARPPQEPPTAPAAAAAEQGWRDVIDAQATDLRTVRRFASDPGRPEAAEAVLRLRARAAPAGAADAAMRVVLEAYGGDVPVPVRRRLERYVVEHLHSGAPPVWPERDESEATDEPALLRKQRRQRRGGHR